MPCVLFPIIRMIRIRNWKYETPAYYIMENNFDGARKALSEIYYDEYLEKRLEIEKKNYLTTGENLSTRESENEKLSNLLKTSPNLKIVTLGTLLFFNQQFAGINAVNFYSTKVFNDLGNDKFSSYLTAIWGLVDITSVSLSLFFVVDNFKRKTLLNFGNYSIAFILLLIGYLSTTDYKPFAILSFFAYIIIFNVSLGPITWSVIAEMTHSRLINLPVASHWIFAFFIAQLFPVMIDEKYFGLNGTFYLFAIITLGCGVILCFQLEESKGLSKGEILEVYKGGEKILNGEEILELNKTESRFS